MLKDLAPKLGIGVIAAGGVSGIAAFASHQLSKVSIKDTLKGRLLDFGTIEDNKWKQRASLLTKNKNNLSPELAKIAEETKVDISKLKKWCETNSENTFFSNSDPLFSEIVKYCTYTIKEKIGVSLANSWNDGKNNKKLISAEDTKLSKTMKEIKAKLTPTNEQKDDNVLKNWCSKVYELPFESEKDQNILDAREYCGLLGR